MENENLDQTYEPEQLQIAEDVQSSPAVFSYHLTDILYIATVTFQIVKPPVHEISSSTRRTLKRKLKQVQEEARKQFAESVAPTQGDELIAELLCDSKDDSDEDDIPRDIASLLNAYSESDSQGKLIILSLVDHDSHSKTSIQKYFGCTRYEVDKARKLKALSKGLSVPSKVTFRRNKLNI